MKIGIDYWQVISDYPEYFAWLADRHLDWGDEVYVVSAIGKSRIGTVEHEVDALGIPRTAVHEVVFKNPKESPLLKLSKCWELGITVFSDDRDDVCRLLNKHGILAMRVTRKDDSASDLEAERTIRTCAMRQCATSCHVCFYVVPHTCGSVFSANPGMAFPGGAVSWRRRSPV